MKIDLLAGLENTVEILVFIIMGGSLIKHYFKVPAKLKICRQRILIATELQNNLVFMNTKMHILKNREQGVFIQIIYKARLVLIKIIYKL